MWRARRLTIWGNGLRFRGCYVCEAKGRGRTLGRRGPADLLAALCSGAQQMLPFNEYASFLEAKAHTHTHTHTSSYEALLTNLFCYLQEGMRASPPYPSLLRFSFCSYRFTRFRDLPDISINPSPTMVSEAKPTCPNTCWTSVGSELGDRIRGTLGRISSSVLESMWGFTGFTVLGGTLLVPL